MVMEPVAWVPQEDRHGCHVAALAIVASMTYAEVKAWFLARMPDHDFTRAGLTHYPVDDFLAEHGFAVVRRWAAFCHALRLDGWPPEPFGPVHLCEVSSALGGHAVVMLADGGVLDPATPARRRLAEYEQIHSVTAIYRLAALGERGEPVRRNE